MSLVNGGGTTTRQWGGEEGGGGRGEGGPAVMIPVAVHGFIGRERERLGHPTNLAMTGHISLDRLLLPYLYHILEYYRDHRERHMANGQNRNCRGF